MAAKALPPGLARRWRNGSPVGQGSITRSFSLFGLSDVKCYFTWSTGYNDARQEVVNRLQFVQLPAGLQGQLSPWNAIGEVFRYRVTGKGYTLKDLKTAEDWILERQFKHVQGVIDVTSYGGETKQYHVEVDPYRLRGDATTLAQLTSAIQNANQNVGGQRLFMGEQSYDVRGIGLLGARSGYPTRDIENVVIAEQKGDTGSRTGHRRREHRLRAASRPLSAAAGRPNKFYHQRIVD
jgi:cobalt-zinc-cadmium resistance protein CzcA